LCQPTALGWPTFKKWIKGEETREQLRKKDSVVVAKGSVVDAKENSVPDAKDSVPDAKDSVPKAKAKAKEIVAKAKDGAQKTNRDLFDKIEALSSDILRQFPMLATAVILGTMARIDIGE
jgi:hypothetical protein